MGWLYQFIHADATLRHTRRVLLDRYALIAQASPLVLVLLVLVGRITRHIHRRWFSTSTNRDATYAAIPGSPSAKRPGKKIASSWVSASLRKALWWLDTPVEFAGWGLGRRDELILGGIWTTWLLFLCVNDAGNDYFLLTKKFASVGTSQLPLQYILASKRVNSVALALGKSHEEINRWHRGLGWIVFSLIFSHGALYLNYYVQVGGLTAAFFRVVPALGMLGLSSMTLLSTTTLAVLRRYSYRFFYITHILVALALPVVIWFHVPHGRWFMAESLLVLLIDMATRRFTSVNASAAVEMVPGADLIKVTARVPLSKIRRFAQHPASHVYLSIPSGSRPGRNLLSPPNLALGLTSNPFTIASVNEETSELTLVARRMQGPMTNTLTKLASLHAPDTARVALRMDGPYGATRHFPDWANAGFDRVLLVAGGVGATFVVPLYRHIASEVPSTTRVELDWAVRDASETAWLESTAGAGLFGDVNDNDTHLFVTGSRRGRSGSAAGSSDGSEGDDLEMNRLEKSVESTLVRETRNRLTEQHGRPDLQEIVSGVFGHNRHHRVAVVVCGPPKMGCDVRDAVRSWVQKGRDVWFHSEGFGW
ncbi:hypothetical protein VTI74DRAFT_1132 [Chaetomium olivicolor]